MTFSLHHDGAVMSSQITPRQSSNTHSLAHIPGSCALIFSSWAVFTLPQPHHVTASHPSPDYNPPKRGRAVRKNTWTKQKRQRETQLSTYAPGLSTLSYLSRRAPFTDILLLLKATFTPSIQPYSRSTPTDAPLKSAINALLAKRHPSILSTCPNHLKYSLIRSTR